MTSTNTKRALVFVLGAAIFATATWFAFKPPSSPPLAASILDDASTTPATTTPSATLTVVPSKTSTVAVAVAANSPKAAAKIVIEITSPASDAQWVVGTENSITWNKAAGSPGQIYLVDAASGVVVGWVQQAIGPAQTFFPWDTRDLFLSQTNPLTKDVAPGKYILKMTFLSPGVESAVSAPFWIVAPTK